MPGWVWFLFIAIAIAIAIAALVLVFVFRGKKGSDGAIGPQGTQGGAFDGASGVTVVTTPLNATPVFPTTTFPVDPGASATVKTVTSRIDAITVQTYVEISDGGNLFASPDQNTNDISVNVLIPTSIGGLFSTFVGDISFIGTACAVGGVGSGSSAGLLQAPSITPMANNTQFTLNWSFGSAVIPPGKTMGLQFQLRYFFRVPG